MRIQTHGAVAAIGLVAALVACNATHAEVFNLDTTDGPLWDRPRVTGGSTTGEIVPYIAFPFAVSTSGTYTFTATPQTAIFDLV